jgi:antitoxin CptB|tara:strand:- start:53 stop:310 length:258 start_codon:yes stop_codon:yes gene_type:complete
MTENKELLKKQIVYRSTHRGTKEMDILLGSFVKKYVEQFDVSELIELKKLLFIDDEVIYNWYIKKDLKSMIPDNNVSAKLKNFKL